MSRYVIASEPADGEVELDWALDLPDVEHVHVTIRDGEVTAVPMRSAADRLETLEALVARIAERGPTVGYSCAWCDGMPGDTRPDEGVWAVKDHTADCLWLRAREAVKEAP